MKVLHLVTEVRKSDTNYTKMAATCIAVCQGLGYEVESIVVADNSTYIANLDTSDYAFTLLPVLRQNVGSGSAAYYDVFDLDIPVIIPNAADTGNVYDDLIGADGNTSDANRKIDYPTVGDLYLNCRGWQPLGATTTALGTDYATGELVFWKNEPVGKAPVYCMGGWDANGLHQALPILIQQAIADGYIVGDKLPPSKLRGMWDIDDVPNSLNTLADIQNIYAEQLKYNWPITWGLKTNEINQLSPPGSTNQDVWAGIDQSLKDFIAARTPDKKGLAFTISHNHNWHWNGSDTGADTKVEMDTIFRGDIARAQADGISMGRNADGLDSWGYIYPPNNNVSDLMFQLGSPDTALLSSPLNDVEQVGYDWKAVRLFKFDSAADGYGASERTRAARKHRGMVLLNGSFIISDSDINYTPDSATERENFARTFARWFTECMGYNAVHYWHGNNFLDGHDGGNAPALKVMKLIGEWSAFLSDVHVFQHPSTYVEELLESELEGGAFEVITTNGRYTSYQKSVRLV